MTELQAISLMLLLQFFMGLVIIANEKDATARLHNFIGYVLLVVFFLVVVIVSWFSAGVSSAA